MFKLALLLLVPALVIAPASTVLAQSAQGDQLLVQRIQQEKQLDLPTRGMTMAQVQHRFGAPLHKLSPRGGDAPKHPLIKRWKYATYIVYFEHDHVIHTVLNTPAGNNQQPQQAQ